MSLGRERRNAWITVGLVGLLVLFTALQGWLRHYDFPNVVLHAIFNLNFVLLVALLIMLGRNLFKLAQQRRQPQARAGLPLRMVLYSLALVLPLTMLTFVALSETLITIVEKWFEPPIDRMLDDAISVPLATLEHLREQARAAGDALLGGGAEGLELRVRELGLAGAELRQPGCEPVRVGEVPGGLEPLPDSGRWLPRPDGTGLLLLERRRGGSGVVVALGFPLILDELARSIARQVADYKEAKRVHVPVRKNYVMALGVLTLASVFSAAWAAFQVARGVSGPISQLAHAARAIAQSPERLERAPAIELDAIAPAELHVLVESFERMRRTLAERTLELEQASRMAAWREVARRVAHEVKNPLTPIQLSAQRLRRRAAELPEPLRELVEECTQTIGEEVANMRRLVDDFSRFARLPKPSLRGVDLNQLARSVASLFEGSLELALEPGLPEASADPDLLRQALLNLVNNALEATGGRGPVRLRTYAGVGWLGIGITDRGPGIASSDLDKLFQPGYSTKGEGSGLGLAIVRQILEEHRGRVRVSSEPGEGTTFSMEIPA